MSDASSPKPIAPVPANEAERLRALHRYRVLDTSAEVAFDRITKLAARLFDVPTALISLVDESRSWFKSCVGFDACEVPRDETLCSFAVLTDEPLIIPDASLDERFACNPFVRRESGVRFYAGAPLRTQDGFNLGTLCLLDTQPRDPLSAAQQATLVDLAAMVVDELELRLADHKFIEANTERKQAEADRDRFFHLSHDMLAIIDRDGYFTQLNPAFTETLGYSTQALMAQPCIEFVHPDDQAKTIAEAEIVSQGSSSIDFENRYRAQDGSYRWISWNVVPFIKPEARQEVKPEARQEVKQELLYCVARDVTDRKQTEASLQASNDRLKLLSSTANHLLLNENPKAFLTNLFAQVSTYLELEVYFNYLFEEDQQRLHLHAYSGISNEISESASILELGQGICGYALQQRQPVVIEAALSSDSPLALPLQSIGIRAYASHPLIVGDRILGTLGLGTRQRDRFTQDELDLMQAVANQVAASLERSRLVLALETRAEALAQTNRIKDEFLAVLSHELRSPLNPILGWTRLLQGGKLDSSQQATALDTIERNAKLQSQLIEDLLDISRIMQGKLTLTAAPVRLPFVISSAIETVRLAAEAKNVQILLDLDTTVAPVSGDATRLQQVVWNLLTNAVKFTPAGGQITIELRQQDQSAQIRVRDTGKGIDPQFLPHVFAYFRQADSSTTRRFGGLGLGLAIVRQIVEMHGGTVNAESLGEDRGATFTVQLPIVRQNVSTIAEPAKAKAENTDSALSGLQILLVDDDTDAREFQAFLLEQSGATVTAVDSGSAALEVLDRSIPDVLVSDIGMAEMDGYRLIQQIRDRPPHQGGTMQAIAVTAYARDFDHKKALQSGFQSCVTKPVEPEVLIGAIVNLIDCR